MYGTVQQCTDKDCQSIDQQQLVYGTVRYITEVTDNTDKRGYVAMVVCGSAWQCVAVPAHGAVSVWQCALRI